MSEDHADQNATKEVLQNSQKSPNGETNDNDKEVTDSSLSEQEESMVNSTEGSPSTDDTSQGTLAQPPTQPHSVSNRDNDCDSSKGSDIDRIDSPKDKQEIKNLLVRNTTDNYELDPETSPCESHSPKEKTVNITEPNTIQNDSNTPNISVGESSIYGNNNDSQSEAVDSADAADIESNQEKQEVPYGDQPILPKRHVLLLMLFLGFAVIYSLRVNINVAIVAMVNNRTLLNKHRKIIMHVAEFDWDSHTQALVVGSFYYGYWVLQVPGAWIAMRLGATRIFGYGTLLASLLALITPVATRYHVYALAGLRIVQGIFLSVTFPCVISIWAKWAPPLERSTMVTMAIAGSPVGNIVAIPITGLLAKYGFDGGWPSVFYFFGFLGILWYIIWELIIYDSPSSHPTISVKEKDYIEKTISEKPFDPLTESLPWRAIFTSIPMWGIIIGHFGACWGYYTLFTQMPTYLKDIQHLDIKTMGLVAATPYLFKAFLGPLGGISADMLLRYKYLTVRGVRTLFYGVGCLLAGFFILMAGYYVRAGEAIAFLILGVGFSGLNATGYAVNHLDLAPRYAGVLMGISNTFATIPGFLSPMVTGHIAKNKKASEWKIVFWITFIIYVVATGLYTIMCSGTKQSWAEGYLKHEVTQEENDDEVEASDSNAKDELGENS